jgi:hypothetical protein
MCRERGSVLFYPRKSFNNMVLKHEPERLVIEENKQQYAHLLSANDQTILNEIIEKEKFELLRQLEDDGDQPEACFIKQALEENNVNFIDDSIFYSIRFIGKRKNYSRTN